MCLARIKAWYERQKEAVKFAADAGYKVGYNKGKELDEKWQLTKRNTEIQKK